MYLIGSELTGKTGFASMVLVQRVRKDLKKYYHVLDTERSQFAGNAVNCIEAIESLYKDVTYTIRKPRFSQIGRPKKIVNEKPLIFIAFCDDTSELIADLKHRNIPANCVFVNDEDTWYTHIPGKCLKTDFYIPKKVLIRNIITVFEDNRVVMCKEAIKETIIKTCQEYINLRSESINTSNIKSFDDLILSLAMPVWYYENLLSIRPRTP